jgi:glycerol 3-phosphatase-2
VNIADRFDAFLFDLDGVVYLGDEPLPGARESLARLRAGGKQVRFLTNNPRPTRKQVAQKLVGMGVEAYPEEVVTSGRATALYLRESELGSAYVVGSRGLASEIEGVGVEVVDRGPCEAVVVGADEHVSYAHIRQAARWIFDGARFVATNADGSFPSPKGPLPGTGAIVEAVRATTGREPVVVGKPFPAMFEMALKTLNAGRDRVVMIGDSPETDIEGARRAGILGVLVAGEGARSTAAEGPREADAVVEDLTELFGTGIMPRGYEGPNASPKNGSRPVRLALVIVDDGGRVLLTRETKGGSWGLPVFPTGPDGAIVRAVMWEASSRLGVGLVGLELAEVYVEPVPGSDPGPRQVALLCKGRTASAGREPGAAGSPEIGFFAPDSLPENLEEADLEWLRDALADEWGFRAKA